MCMSVIALFSCSQSPEEKGEAGDNVAIKVGAQINTKAVDTQWQANDVIGITMFKRNTTDLAEGNYRNCQYTVRLAGASNFEPIDESNLIFFPKDGSEVSFMAYYPYNANASSSYIMPINVSSQTNLPKIDFMMAKQTGGYSKSDPNVKLQFTHKLSKIIINLELKAEIGDQPGAPGNNPQRLIGSKIKITGMMSKGTFDLVGVNPAVVVDPTSGADLQFTTDVAGANAIGIVLPRPAGAGVVFEVELLDGAKFKGYMDSNLVLSSGFQYGFNLKLSKTHIDVSATINPWQDGSAVTLNAINVVTPPNASVNIPANSVMTVYSGTTNLAQFTYGADGLWTSPTPVYWENLASTVVFNASIAPTAALNATQLPDYILADQISVNRFSPINFIFRHAGTKVTAVLSSSDGTFSSTELAGASVRLPNYITGGTVTNGQFVAGSVPGNITLVNNVAIFQPQTINAAANLVIVTINGKDYVATAPAGGIQYKMGEARNLNINLQKSNITVSASIVDWTTGSDISLTGKWVTVSTPNASANFTVGNIISLFVLNNNNATSNFVYQANGSWLPVTPLYWDNLTTFPINVSAVYPGSNTAPTGNSYPWEVFSNQSAGYATSDLLVAYSASNAAGAAINLQFYHAMSKVNIVLVGGTGFVAGELNSATVVIKNMFTNCNVDLTTIVTSSLINQADIIPFKTSNLNFSAMVAPSTLASGAQILEINISGKIYPVLLTSSMTFAPKKFNTLTVTVNKTQIGISCGIEGWVAGDNGDYIIQ